VRAKTVKPSLSDITDPQELKKEFYENKVKLLREKF